VSLKRTAEDKKPQPFYGPFSGDYPGEPVPEENFWTSWCKGKINTGIHRPSGWAPLHPD